MTKKTRIAAATLILLAPAALLAADWGPREGGLHRWDSDGDGVVTRQEAQDSAAQSAARLFDKLDRDKDGQVTQEEMREAQETRRARAQEQLTARFQEADSDGDGALSREEVEQGMPMMARRFARLDRDRDGRLTQEELQAAAKGGRRARR